MMMLNVTINDRQLQVEEGKTILEVALDEGIKIPTLCYHKELTPYGACRLCLVEIVGGGRPGLEASCIYKVTDRLEVKTDTDRVKKARKIIFELLLARCPDAEAIKKLAAEYGVTGTRIKLKQKENCILCGLCVRVCGEISQRHAQSFAGRGERRNVQTSFYKVSERCIGCGACAYLCPVEALKIEEAD
jgi:bidirectional [NiFe] hydrogenase diaphorase subunit